MSFDFFAPPYENIEYLKSKKPELHFDYDEIMHEAHHKTFTIAKITNLDLLKDMQDSLINAYKKGLGFDEWKDSVKPVLIQKGWYGSIKVINPKTKEEKEIYVGSRRLKTIYQTNMRTSFAVARYTTQMDSDAQFFRYISINDSRTRPAHKALHGIVLPKTDKFWDTFYPPNDWNCRCKVRAYTKEELESNGFSQSTVVPSIKPHKDWAYNVGKRDNLDIYLKEKIEKIRDKQSKFYKRAKELLAELDHKRNMYVWQRGLDNAINELLINKNIKSPIAFFALGKIDKNIIKKSEKILKTKIETNHIMGDKQGILHIRPERKGKYGQDLRIDEISQIVKVLDDKNTPVSVDIKNKNIIFWFDDEKDSQKINKIIVNLNYKLKKFGVSNYMVTAGKVDRINHKEGSYVKIR